ncbi:MAG: hypothetical protein ACREJ9_13175 [Candidatus Rokuibacteriota bacterium]
MNDGDDSFLVIVSRREPWLFATLTRVFESSDRVHVILDRRADVPPPAGGVSERRQQDVSVSLRELGWAVVPGRAEAPPASAVSGSQDDAVMGGRP